MVAANSPIATKETATPAASTAGPQRCSDAAAPSTIGSIGSTQGDKIDRIPATNARTNAPNAIGPSERFVQERGNRGTLSITDGAGGFCRALERDQRRLHSSAEKSHRILLSIKVHHEINQVVELRLRHQFTQDWLLRLAGRTPGGVDCDEDRLAGFLCRRKGTRIEGPGLCGECGRNWSSVCGNGGEDKTSARKHD